ncbi:cytochrome c oxidase subunit II [Halovivax limisalsi]|uniref:cytochrome c oxidase subunit II n=1 Tax=Halovivax limisalsi TaxID=1453760 RepID=UPI001FFCF96D|nr:cytochrome c oxidase subunit II [Halovivax limisalsi]
MRIHTYERLWLVASLVLIVGFIATVTYGAVGIGIEMIGDEPGTIDPDAIGDDDRFGDPRVEQVGPSEYEVYVVAYTFIFQPAEIEVPADSEVTFYLTSADVIHGFEVAGTNVNSMVIPGQIAQLTVEFDEPGTYGVVCNEYCGPGHHTMEGSLTVVPAERYDQTSVAVTAPNAVEASSTVDLTATVSNGLLEARETTVTVDIAGETVERDVTIPGDGSENVTVEVDSGDLGAGEHDWSVSVDGLTESGTITVDERAAATANAVDERAESATNPVESEGAPGLVPESSTTGSSGVEPGGDRS